MLSCFGSEIWAPRAATEGFILLQNLESSVNPFFVFPGYFAVEHCPEENS